MIGVILSSLLSDDCEKSTQESPKAGLRISTSHQLWHVSLPSFEGAFTTLPTLCP